MSFDPQNPRNSPRPTPDQPTPARYVPPQPSPERRSPTVLLAGAAVIALGILAVVAILVLNGGAPAATVQPSASASAIASAIASAPASAIGALPTTDQSVPPTPETSPATPYDAFLLHVPAAIRSSCTGAQATGIEFTTLCTTTDGIRIIYDQYASADAMNAAYQETFATVQIDANSGSCEDHSTWPAESTYEVDGALAGHRLCADMAGAPTITWTDDRIDILAIATGDAANVPGLVAFWATDAGPVP